MKTEWESECWLSTYLSDLFLGARFFLVYAAHLKISPRQTNLVSSHENKNFVSCDQKLTTSPPMGKREKRCQTDHDYETMNGKILLHPMTNLTHSLTHSAMPALYESLRSNLFTAQQDREVLRLHTYPCAERKLNFPFCFYQVAEWFKPPIYEAQASKIGKNGWFPVGIPGVRCKCFAMPGSF